MSLQRAGSQQRRIDHLLDAHGFTPFPRFNAFLIGQCIVPWPGSVNAPCIFPCREKKRHGAEPAFSEQPFPVFLVPVRSERHSPGVFLAYIPVLTLPHDMHDFNGPIRFRLEQFPRYRRKLVFPKALFHFCGSHPQTTHDARQHPVGVQRHGIGATGLAKETRHGF